MIVGMQYREPTKAYVTGRTPERQDESGIYPLPKGRTRPRALGPDAADFEPLRGSATR